MTLLWKKFPILNDGFICLADFMGNDWKIASRARTSYGKSDRAIRITEVMESKQVNFEEARRVVDREDAGLIRRLMRDRHTSPFEFCQIEFLVRAPIYVFRQWHRHRTASINEYSGRYKEMTDSMETTPPGKWRLQSGKNKQGSDGYLKDWPEGLESNHPDQSPGEFLSEDETFMHKSLNLSYKRRLALGVAKEQARKDLPVSNYSEMYWSCDLHNLLHFLTLRMDKHAQEEIRLYANQMGEIVKELFPVTWQAFEDYRLNAMQLTALDIKAIQLINQNEPEESALDIIFTNKTEKEECSAKLKLLGIL